MSGLCIAAALGVALGTIPTERFTLAWTHSVEKIRWEEDYELRPQGLVAVAARVRGSGAGMEVPEGARWRDGAWEYRPALPPLPRLRLTYSRHVADYVLCWQDRCRPLAPLAGGSLADGTVVEIFPCR